MSRHGRPWSSCRRPAASARSASPTSTWTISTASSARPVSTPAVNQIELHPRFQQRDKREFHATHNIRIESWSPLGSGRLIDDPTLAAIGKKHGKSVAQVMIRWHLQEGLIAIPKSMHKERIAAKFRRVRFRAGRPRHGDDPRHGCARRAQRPRSGERRVPVLIGAGESEGQITTKSAAVTTALLTSTAISVWLPTSLPSGS